MKKQSRVDITRKIHLIHTNKPGCQGNCILQTVLLALGVCGDGLEGLASTSAALDLKEYWLDVHLSVKGKVQPVAPDIPKALPFVHQLWGPLMAALKVQQDLLLKVLFADIIKSIYSIS